MQVGLPPPSHHHHQDTFMLNILFDQRELEQWKGENQSLALQLKKEESLTAQTLQPLAATLEDLTAAVNDQLDKISLVKSNILKNEIKIEKMVSSIGLAHK